MTILTSIAWESVNPFKAISKGIKVYKNHFGEIVVGVGFSNVMKLVMALPSFGFYYLLSNNYPEGVPSWGYIAIFIYFGIVWAVTLMIEQIYVAELYIWYKVYESEKKEAELGGYEAPQSMYKVKKRPSLFDNIADFADENVTKGPERY